MSVTRFADLLERVMGLSAASIGAGAIERAVETRRRASGARDADAYWALLHTAPDEFQQLVDTVVVPETWFFRTPQAFRAMARMLAPHAGASHAGARLRLLSLPCSTGEEAYTLAMALLDSGMPEGRFRIDGVDISQHAIEQACVGIYGRNSFRGTDTGFRERHFDAVGQGWSPRAAVRRAVHFEQGNIFAPDFRATGAMAGASGYDVIFCRNLLIYFDPPRQRQALAVLDRLLAPGGTLFVGHSEAGLMAPAGFVPAGMALAFAFRRAPVAPVAIADPAPAKRPVAGIAPFRPAPVRHAEAPVRRLRERPGAPVQQPELDLATLRRMVDSGRLEEAARGCEATLRAHGASVEALVLSGLIHDALGAADAAARAYRKALYLDPGHAEALGHLALLLRRQGDRAGAELLDARVRRHHDRKRG